MIISTRAKILVLGVILCLIIILILFFLPRPGAERARETTVEAPVVSSELEEEAEVTPPPPPKAEEVAEVSSETVGKIFVERFGSYSTEANLENIEDVLPLATASFRRELEEMMEENRAAAPLVDYYGVSTRVISVDNTVMDLSIGRATLLILTQREEAKGSLQKVSVRYQTIVVELEKEEGEWRVEGAEWQ